jgi:uncharacterized repeat protein (TIGR02543 family)
MKKNIKIGLLSLFIGVITLWPSVSVHAAELDTNLLVNPGGESVAEGGMMTENGWNGDIQGYSYSGDFSTILGIYPSLSTVLTVTPHSGNYFMGNATTSSPGSGSYNWYQDIDISSQSAAIANNTLVFHLSGYLCATGENMVGVSLQELDDSGNIITTPIYSSESTSSTWTQLKLSGAIVSNASKLRVTITGSHSDYGISGFDDLSLMISTNEDKPPVVSQVTNQTALTGDTVGPLDFEVSDLDNDFDSLTISAISSNTNLIPNSNITASLSNGNGSILFSSVSGQTGSSIITVSVSDGTKTTSMPFSVTVHPNVTLDTNLVTNGTGEAIGGWTDSESRFTYGTSFGLVNLPTGASAYYMYQDIDVSKYADMIDANFLTFTSSCDATGSGTMTLTGYNAASAQIWQSTNKTTPLPAQTRTVRITVGGPVGCSIDNISFKLNSTGLPKCTSIANQIVTNGSSTGNLDFTIGYATNSASLTASSSNQSVVKDSDITLGGSNYHRTICVVPQNGVSGTTTITISLNGSTLKTFDLNSIITVTGITITPSNQTVPLGGTINLTPIFSPAHPTNQNVTWSSSDPSIATVDNNGTVTAKAAGTAVITAVTADGSFTASCTISVTLPINLFAISGVSIPVNDQTPSNTITETDQYTGTISWSPNDSTFLPDTTYTATITLTPKDGYTLTNVAANSFTVTGASTVSNTADSGVITVVFPKTQSIPIVVTDVFYDVTYDSQGGSDVSSQTIKNGDAIITIPVAPTKDGYTFAGWYKEADCMNAWVFSSDKVTSNVTLFAKWTAVTSTPVTPDPGTPTPTTPDPGTPSPTTPDPGTPSPTTPDPGTPNPTTPDPVAPSPTAPSPVTSTAIALSNTDISLSKGAATTLAATISPDNATNKSISWSSSNTSVATVDSAGQILGKGYGTATIIATTNDSSNLKSSCNVVVGYRLNYNLKGGENDPQNPSSYYNAKVNLKSPMRSGYSFSGWYTDKKYKNKITTIKNTTKKDYTLYAKWTKVSVTKGNIQSLKNSKANQLTVKLNKVDGSKGYEITYATDKGFTSTPNTVTITGTSTTLKDLTKGNTYYVKIRAYKIDSSGEKVFGKYSSVKKIKLKK